MITVSLFFFLAFVFFLSQTRNNHTYSRKQAKESKVHEEYELKRIQFAQQCVS